ncbi:MAG: sporulation protein YabP [Ruminococcaceae bacterium]|nr:sporulation protein YabP [Oscillospiraceae bacterium]
METNETKASLVLLNRKTLNLTDINDVISFDEMNIYLVTKNNGNLLIEGTDLHITTLDVASGNMTVEGIICSMIYNDKESKKKESFISRILK